MVKSMDTKALSKLFTFFNLALPYICGDKQTNVE